LIRPRAGAVAQFEKAMVVEKLSGAGGGRLTAGGQKNYAEPGGGSELIALTRKLQRVGH